MSAKEQILGDEAFLNILAERLQHREPTSAVRKGDGENIVLGYGLTREVPFQKYRKKMKHYNVHIWDLALQLKLRSELARAYQDADFLGISRPENRSGFWRNETFILEYFGLTDKPFFDMNFHFRFIKQPDTNALLDAAAQALLTGKKIGVVSHWDVGPFLKTHGSEQVARFTLPKRRSRFHFMSVRLFDELRENLQAHAQKADLWFVAAGVYAKPFCNAIKSGGGFALDIGSSMDSWMNVYETRGHLRRIAKQYRNTP